MDNMSSGDILYYPAFQQMRIGSQIIGSRLHTRSVLLRLAGERGDGQESQQKVEDVRRFHGPKQGLPQGQLASPAD